MTPEGLLAFRISAALVSAFRGLRIRVSEGGQTVLEVWDDAARDRARIRLLRSR